MSKYRLTQSLLSSWLWSYKKEDGFKEFVNDLNLIPKQPTEQILNGIQYENCLNSMLNGEHIPETHKWYKPLAEMSKELNGSQQQVDIKSNIIVDGVMFQLHGILDYLKAGVIYDCKFSEHYQLNKFLLSSQHPMYFKLVPEAYKFVYIISDGHFVYKETYYPEDTIPIETLIRQFMKFLERYNLIETYTSLWDLETYYENKKKRSNK